MHTFAFCLDCGRIPNMRSMFDLSIIPYSVSEWVSECVCMCVYCTLEIKQLGCLFYWNLIINRMNFWLQVASNGAHYYLINFLVEQIQRECYWIIWFNWILMNSTLIDSPIVVTIRHNIQVRKYLLYDICYICVNKMNSKITHCSTFYSLSLYYFFFFFSQIVLRNSMLWINLMNEISKYTKVSGIILYFVWLESCHFWREYMAIVQLKYYN